MANTLRCRICYGEHKADSKHFPVVIRSKKDNTPLGYICVKCARKEMKREERENRLASTGKTM